MKFKKISDVCTRCGSKSNTNGIVTADIGWCDIHLLECDDLVELCQSCGNAFVRWVKNFKYHNKKSRKIFTSDKKR